MYHNILISDHAPVSLSFKLKSNREQHNWHLNNSLLKDKVFCTFLSEKIQLFLDTNDKGDVNGSALWEAMKAVLRGHVIACEAAEKKKAQEKLVVLQKQLAKMENTCKNNPTTEIHNKTAALKFEYNSVLSETVCKLLMQARQKYFEFGGRPHRLRQMLASRAIHGFKSKCGTILTDPVKMNKCVTS